MQVGGELQQSPDPFFSDVIPVEVAWESPRNTRTPLDINKKYTLRNKGPRAL